MSTQPCHSIRDRASPSLRSLLMTILLGLALTAPYQAAAVLISTGDGTGNTTPPGSDPGFQNVGVVNGLTGVYVGNGWVLTANHVGEHPILLLGVSYDPVPGSSVRLQNPDATLADLIAFKLRKDPPLPALTLATGAPSTKTLVTIVGYGVNRGTATTWSGIDGWNWGSGRAIRWGTNRIASVGDLVFGTQSFAFDFDQNPSGPPGQDEADVVVGDSGGAAFTGSGGSAELIGILFARGSFLNQPDRTSLYGNVGYASDLFQYRNAILALVDQPDCNDGLDEDGDGLADYPDDPGCTSALDTDEQESTLVCDNGIDDDNDDRIDFPEDLGCSDGLDTSERGAPYACDNGIDDDLDLLADYPDDTDCLYSEYPTELPEPSPTSMLAVGVLVLGSLARRRSGLID
jgi:hypothetical protein